MSRRVLAVLGACLVVAGLWFAFAADETSPTGVQTAVEPTDDAEPQKKARQTIETVRPGALAGFVKANGQGVGRARVLLKATVPLTVESLDDGARLDARRVDVDPRELRRLRRGQFAIDGRLDLHGLSLEEARKAVEAFIRKRSAEGDKVVSIIHGKGTHSPRQQGVLRGEIGAWLSQGRAARHVLAFATAPDEDGGEGALLVLLAR